MKKRNFYLVGLILFILSISFICADSVPYSAPCAFKGNIIVNDGSNPNGKLLTAQVDGVTTGSAIISNNKYDLIAVDYTFPYNGKVTFKIGSEEAKESADFTEYGINNLNLIFDTIPSIPPTCGDGTCEAGECSNCAIDCAIADCKNNSKCDAVIGENCLNDESECGVCPVLTPPSSPGPSSGGPSGGGGGGNPPSYTPSSSGSGNTNTGIPITLSTGNKSTNKTTNNVPTTGLFILDFAKSSGGIATGLGLITALILGIAIMVSRKKKSAGKKEEESSEGEEEEGKKSSELNQNS